MRVNRKELHLALVACAKVTDLKNPLPALRSVLLRLGEDAAFLSATDLTRYLICTVPGSIGAQPGGSCVVPLKTFAGLVQPIGRAKAGQVVELQIACEGVRTKLIVSIEQDATTIWCSDAGDFPEIPPAVREAEGKRISYVSGEFAKSIEYVGQACETAPYRHLNMINLAGQYMTATDGHRLHREILVPSNNALFPDVLIPDSCGPVFSEICGRLDSVDDITLEYLNPDPTMGESWLRADCPRAGREFFVRLSDAQAPDYERVIPSAKVIPHKIFLESSFLERALSRMRKVVPSLCQPTLTLNADSAKLNMVSKDDDTDIEMALNAREIQFRPQAKRIVEEIDGATVEREEIPTEVTVCFDAAYMMDAIDGAKGEIVVLFSEMDFSPIRIDVSPSRLAIVMPVRF